MIDPAADPVPGGSVVEVPRVWAVVRVVLIVLWVVASACSWWTAPRKQSYEQLRTDLAAGQVVAHRWGTSWVDIRGRWFENPQLQESGTLGPLFAWRTGSGRVRWIDTGDFTGTAQGDSTGYSGPGAVDVAQQLSVAGQVSEGPDLDPFRAYGKWLWPLLGLVLLGVLIAGPAPALGTRWFWFWLVLGVPYGLGFLFWLFRDRPWARAAGPGHRDRGWLGFVIGALASLVVSLLVVLLHHLLGDRWIPSPEN